MSPDTPLTWFGLTTTPLELVSFALAVLTVWLNIGQNHWAWLFSILSSLLYAAVFADARLYGDAGLQFVFVAVSVWGWYQWLRGGEQYRPLQVSTLTRSGWAMMATAWLAGWWLLSWFLQRYTDTDVPHMDGFLTAGSLVGQFLLSRKKLENWLVWIAVDVLYVGLYLYKHLTLTAMLYALFVVMAAAGWRRWKLAGSGSRY
ncbi:nicotinamide riboside transporter PnuC [Herbaspirillum sp. BH-1]|uniref:Nicotinamide riboside transporter PnuC n=1 Tax=Herbaspirillum frisingense TaxID=92645 RepID=A0ABU1PA02_9BURK|nr:MULTISPECIES: nicotinamide riboside transporter PnuC [Herbaspirillum]MDR6582762.1 nicotinamide mononucleotide transporter [Herbaspirillum frisingense]PLY60655.1 nicotinamide riboside transporter PnuC [Herbaspirillum sp. BH-1]